MANRLSSVIHLAAEQQEAKELIQDVVCRLKATLPTECGLTVNSVTCGGPLALGTCCAGRYNSEIIIYSSDVNTKEVECNGYGEWLNKIDRLFQSDELLSECYQFHAVTDTALEFTLDGVEVELMVSPHWGVPANLYSYLEAVKPLSRTKYFFYAGKWQLQFLRSQPNKDYRQEFISRAVAWRELKWSRSTGGQGRPSTYLLALLVLKAHEVALKRLGVFSSLSPDTMAYHTTEELKRIVLNHHTIDIYWEHCYSLRQYPTLVTPRPPRILDPANPANNLYVTGMTSFAPNERQREHKVGNGNWSYFRNHISSLDLSKPVEYWI